LHRRSAMSLISSNDDRLETREARRAPLRLGEQDGQVLFALESVRFATITHLTALLQITRPGVHMRLKRLNRHRYVERRPYGKGFVYSLDELGIEDLAQATGMEKENLRQAELRPVSGYFLDHYLAIADVYVVLTTAARTAGIKLSWWSEVEAAHHYVLPSGQRRKLEPDAVFMLAGAGFASTMAFLEIDRATESSQQWRGKLEDYNGYFLSPEGFTKQWTTRTPRVLVLVTAPNQPRVDVLRKYTAAEWQARLGNAPVPVGFTVHSSILPESVLDLPWIGLDGNSFRLVERTP
jgi:DNA-binding MarR family transcriptional regulator